MEGKREREEMGGELWKTGTSLLLQQDKLTGKVSIQNVLTCVWRGIEGQVKNCKSIFFPAVLSRSCAARQRGEERLGGKRG